MIRFYGSVAGDNLRHTTDGDPEERQGLRPENRQKSTRLDPSCSAQSLKIIPFHSGLSQRENAQGGSWPTDYPRLYEYAA